MSVTVYKTVADLVTADIPLTGSTIDVNGNTPQIVTRRLSNVVVPAGGAVDLRGREEFSTGSTDANWNAAGYWTINGVKSEHWSLWVMVSWGIVRVSGGSSTWVRRQTATNIDSDIHHTTVDFTEWDQPPAGTYNYETWCYFSRSNSYVRPGATVRVEPGYGMLSAAVLL